MQDDRNQPHRQTNTAILRQVGQPPPPSVLGTVLAVTGGAAPTAIAALPEWGRAKPETSWHIFGCTNGALFAIQARKDIDDWYGSSARNEQGDRERITATVVPFSRLTSATFEFSDLWGGDFGPEESTVVGTWHFGREEGETISIPTNASNQGTRDALQEVIATALGSMT